MLTNEQFYEASNLTCNPFQTNAAGEADPRRGIWVGYKKERETLGKFLERSLADQVGNINFVMIFGELGVGKSHALLWSQYQVLAEQKDKFNSVAYYVQTLLKDKGKLSFGIAFQEDIVNKSNLLLDLTYFRQFVEDCVVEYRRDNSLGLEHSWEKLAEALVPSMDLLNFLRDLHRCDTPESCRSLLQPDSDYNAMLLFCRIANLFSHPFKLKSGVRRFKKATYLLIDEADVFADVPVKEAREGAMLLRHIYDLCPSCFFLGLGFTATSADLTVMFPDYIISRVSKNIVLSFLQPEESKEFVREILNTERVDKKKKIDYFPFTEEAVSSIIAQQVSITPRRLVQVMQQVIEECRLVGLNPSKAPITLDDLDKNKIWEMIV